MLWASDGENMATLAPTAAHPMTLLHTVRSANQEQLAILAQGVKAWNRWRDDNPEAPIELSKANPGLGANLREINLRGAVLHDCQFEKADLFGAQLNDAVLLGANLKGATLQSANLTGAVMSGANLDGASLVFADLRGALLQGAKLKGASLHHADFREADLRGVEGAIFDETNVVFAISGLAAKDPWSILRRKYSGVMLLFHLLLLVAFLCPYVARAVIWRAVNHGQQIYVSATGEIVSELRRFSHEQSLTREQWRLRAQRELSASGLNDQVITRLLDDGVKSEFGGVEGDLADRVSRELSGLGPCLRKDCVATPMWRVLFQLDRGFLAAFLALGLLVYNILRGILTWRVGLMRDEQERSGLTPPWRSIRLRGRLKFWLRPSVLQKLPGSIQRFFISDTTFVQMGYRPLFRAHHVLTAMFWSIVCFSLAYHGWSLLTTTVYLPSR